jgi:hypothetical protein
MPGALSIRALEGSRWHDAARAAHVMGFECWCVRRRRGSRLGWFKKIRRSRLATGRRWSVEAFTYAVVTIVSGCEAHVLCARRSGHGFRPRDRLVRSYQGYRPGAFVLAGSGRRLATPQRAWGYRRSYTARPRLQRRSLRQAEVRRRVTSGKAAATPGAGD